MPDGLGAGPHVSEPDAVDLSQVAGELSLVLVEEAEQLVYSPTALE
jgi:hypothetical protein